MTIGGDPKAREFEEMISEVYDLEDGYRLRGLRPHEITAERRGEYTESVVRRLRNRLDEELAKDNEFRSPYMMEALHYLDHFWEGLLLYRKDGAYPIDNNLAERSVRPFATKRKSSLHFGSDEGGRDVGRVPQHHQHVETEWQVGVELLRRLLPERGSGVGYLQGIPAGFDALKIKKTTRENQHGQSLLDECILLDTLN